MPKSKLTAKQAEVLDWMEYHHLPLISHKTKRARRDGDIFDFLHGVHWRTVEGLIRRGLIDSPDGVDGYRFTITDKGRDLLEEYRKCQKD